MRSAKKAIIAALCAVMLVVGSVAGTMAYLTSQDTVTNTFTVGKVQIKLDEAKVGTDGKALTGDSAERVKGNEYHLIPGSTYDKDPTVTVTANSEDSYVRMLVTINEKADLDSIFEPDGIDLNEIFVGYNSDKWVYGGNTIKDDTRVYEFRYCAKVSKSDSDQELTPLFTGIKMPGEITNDELESIEDLEIKVVAEAIQADNFASADAAWAAFPVE